MKNLALTLSILLSITGITFGQENNVKVFGKIWWESNATISEAFDLIIPNSNIGDAFYGAIGIKNISHKGVLILRSESFVGIGTGGFYEYTKKTPKWTFSGRTQAMHFWNKPQLSWGKIQGSVTYSFTKKFSLNMKTSDRYTNNQENIFVIGIESKLKLWTGSSVSTGYIFRSVEKKNGHIPFISFSQEWKNVFLTGTYQCQGNNNFSIIENLFSISIGIKLK